MWDDLDTDKPRGSAIEELTSEFCKRSFLQDFLFLRPKVLNTQRELADLLAILDGKCLCIQIKAVGQISLGLKQQPEKWAIKRLIKAGNQASGSIRKVTTSNIEAIHPWQGNIVFKAGEITPICGIALVEYFSRPFSLADNIKHQTSTGIPIHYFSLNDFLNLVDLLGTLPDIVEYLLQRASMSNDIRKIIGKERNLYATYLQDAQLHQGLTSKDIENSWLILSKTKGEYFDRKNKHNIFVNFYNGIIDELHQRDPDMLSYHPPELIQYIEHMSEKKSYLEIATRLNKLPYIYRREIGKHLFQTAKTVKNDAKIRMFTYPNLGQPWALTFLVTPNMDRTARIRKLHLLVASVQIQYNCQSVIGVACPSLDSNQGYDYIFIDKVKYNKDEISKIGPIIVKSSEIKLTTYPNPEDDSLLPKDEDFE